MENFNLEEVDVDGAIREGIEEVSGDTRLSFLRKGAMAGGAALSGGAILSALVPGAAMAFSKGDRPPAKFGPGDIGILNFALTLEYLEATFYNEATRNQRKSAFLKDAQARVFLRVVTDDENQHVALLKKVLGNKAIKKPKFDFRGATADQAKFLTAAFTFENEGVHAYSGQAFNIKDPKVLAAALSIVTIEARHASVVGLIRNGTPFGVSPDKAFDKPYGATKVLADVGSLKYIK